LISAIFGLNELHTIS